MDEARDLNAFITPTPELALARAGEADDRRARGEAPGPLDGIPIAIKDLFCTEGVLTTAGLAHPRQLRAALRIRP